MKISTAIDGYLLHKSTRASKRTIQTDRQILKQFHAWLDDDPDIKTITTPLLTIYLNHHEQRGLTASTRRRILATISGLYTWLTSPDIELLKTNPAHGVAVPKLPKRVVRHLPREHLELMLQATDRARTPRRARALLLFLIDTGARATEVAEAQLENANLKTGKIKIRGKRDKERHVYLGRRALSALWLYVQDERPDPAHPHANLFLTHDGYPMNRHSIRRAVYRIAKWAGVKANPHLFRHTSAVEHLRAGMNVFALRDHLGHESVKTTQGYLSALNDEDVEKQAQRTSPSDTWRL